MAEQRYEIVFREWGSPADPEKTRIELVIKEDGGLAIDGVDTGPGVEEAFGDWDYEYRIDIAPAHRNQFMAAVLRHAMNNETKLTFGELTKVLESEGIPFEYFSWT